MKPVITKFNDKTGDVEITIPVPFTLKDGIEYVCMMAADIPKYEDAKDYNVFELIRENQELKKQLSNSHQIKAQQREFINWLEDGIRTLEMLDETFILQNYKNEIRIYEEILSKYKEITGVKDGEN